MPSPYNYTGVTDQRDAITKALMNIGAPPPQSQRPNMPQYRPQMGIPQMAPSGAPPTGTPTPGALPTTMPLTPGMPPVAPSGVGAQYAGGTPGQMPATPPPPGSVPAVNPLSTATGTNPMLGG